MELGVVFGKCLNELLMVRGWSAARLAKEINLDPSYIRRWIRGERVPSIKSGYIDEISDLLCPAADKGNILKKNYIAALKELGFKESDLKESKKDLHCILYDALCESQIYSLKLSPEERMIKSVTTEDDIVGLLEKIGNKNRGIERAMASANDSYSIDNIPTLIKDRHSVLCALIALMKAAGEANGKEKEIILTFQSERYPFDGFTKLEELFNGELTKALKRSWRVKHLLRLNKNINRSIILVQRIAEQLGFENQYEPYYFEKYGTISPAFDILIVQGIGALVCFSTEDSEYIDSAFFYKQKEAVESLTSYIIMLIRVSRPLLSVYSLNEYFVYNTETDKKTGDCFIIRDDLDGLTIPCSLWLKYLDKNFSDKEELMVHAERIKDRLDSFYNQVKRYRFMNICSVQAIEHLVKTGNYRYDNTYRLPEKEDIIIHLKNIIYLLETYENFQIGLLNESQLNLLPRTYWEVKGDYSVIIDMWYPEEKRCEKKDPGLFLAINEGTIAGAFRDYFLDLWDRIIPKYRDKAFIIKWFKEQVSYLENN